MSGVTPQVLSPIRQEDGGAERKATHFRIELHSETQVKTHHYIIFFVRQLNPELEMESYS